ncbi:hypothetical protein DFH06DRAFT_1472942 [Mycena polygramma]|nr:hypothetical protein DFH06DRAFT_1472942 [Mycena polygramma]
MADPLSIVQGVFELGMAIKESIDKVVDNKKNLADLKKEVLDTVEELEHLAKGTEDKVPTGRLKTALATLTNQLNTINTNCQALTQPEGIHALGKAWFKRDKIAAEINKLKERRKECREQFQLLSLARVEGTTARTEEHAVLIEAVATRTEGYTARTEATTARTEATTTRTEANTVQLVNSEREKKIREWFQALDMREKQRATYAFRHNDTGRWVLEGTKFAKWKEEPGCLWIRGISGTGKSVLSSIATDHLFRYRSAKIANSHEDAPDCAIAYFYFDFRDEKKQLVENMLRSIIMQLSEQSPTPYSILDQRFKSCQGQILPTYNDLLAMLDTVLSQLPGTYIVLDALDECSEHDKLVEFISTLHGWGKPVHLLVASQPRTLFLESPVFKGASVVFLEPDTTHADILQFVKSELELNSKLKHIKKAKDAAPKIVDKSNGMFRMAACLLQELTRKRVDANIDKILAKLPDDLFGIYTRFLQPIDEDDFVYVATLLRWLAFSAEPVTLRQLDEALAITFSEPAGWVFEPEHRGRVNTVCDLLEGLVVLGPITSKYQEGIKIFGRVATLAHSSVNDYIVSERFLEQYKEDLREAPSHTLLAQSCITYFLHFENNPLNADTLPQYPLAQYAAKFWSHHLLRSHDRGVLQRSTMHFLEQGSQQYVALNCLYDVSSNPWRRAHWSRQAPSPIYLCSWINYVEGVRFLLDHGADVDTAGGKYGSALQGAASRGHMDVIRILVEKGADVNAASGSALQSAALRNHMEIVCFLLQHGANVNAAGGEYGSALLCAVREGHADIVRVLLEKGADVNAVDCEGDSALQVAAWGDHVDVVCVLLDKGADVDAAGGEYGSALQAAALEGHVDIVRLLLEKGADMNAAGGEYGSALQNAAAEGYMDIVLYTRRRGLGRE